MLYALSFVLFLFALSAVQALRAQHLVVLRWPVGYFYLVRGADGRYDMVQPARVPLEIARFGALTVASTIQLVRGRARGWGVAHTSSAVRGATAR